MLAIFKREINSYFSSAIGYIFLAVFYIIAGYFFVSGNLMQQSTQVGNLYNTLIFISIILIPVLTMRLLSEEKKQKTDQLLLTSPVSLTGMVLGKFLAALAIFGIGLSITILYALTMAAYVSIDTAVILGNILGTLLYASALVSIGLFISSLTENQIIAFVGSFFVMLFLYLVGNFSTTVNNGVLAAIISAISINARYNNFSMGIFNLSDAIYYISVAAVFVFLTVRVLEKRRWS